MKFSPDFIDKVRDANDIVEIIGQHTELKGTGSRLMGRCPFPDHSDKSPSFSVTADNQLYFCYGCKKGGNVYTFLKIYNGMTFPEAVEYLARRASIPMPEPESPQERARIQASRDQKDLLLKVNKAAAVFYFRQLGALDEDHVARKYLVKRGLSGETVEKFRIGVALESYQGLCEHFRSRKVPLDAAEQLALIKPKRGGTGSQTHFDLFRERLIFPIFSATGDVVGFGGRTLQPDGIPKYLNSSESPVFSKGRVLYGLHETGKFIRAEDNAIVVEGYMDAIALYAAGIKNVVAILGTAFTADHAKILKRYTANVTVLLDGDDAGVGGAERSLPILLAAGLMPKGFLLPDKMDPDDYVKAHGADKLREEIGRAPELFTLLLVKLWMREYNGSPSSKVRVVQDASLSLKDMQSRQLLDLYVLELSRQLDVEVGWVRKALTEAWRARALAPKPGPAQQAQSDATEAAAEAPAPAESDEVDTQVSVKGAPKNEAIVLSLLLHHESLLRDLVEAGPDSVLELFTSEGVRRVLAWAVRRFEKDPASFAKLAAAVSSRVDLPGIVTCSLQLVPAEPPEGLIEKVMADYLHAMQQRQFKNRAKALLTEFRAQAPQEKLEAFQNLQRARLARDLGGSIGGAVGSAVESPAAHSGEKNGAGEGREDTLSDENG